MTGEPPPARGNPCAGQKDQRIKPIRWRFQKRKSCGWVLQGVSFVVLGKVTT